MLESLTSIALFPAARRGNEPGNETNGAAQAPRLRDLANIRF
jgi:hypothetical protein